MAECKNCFHEKVCKYADEKVSSGTTAKELIHECVDFAPAADVVEVKHGEWADANSIRKSKCSICGIEYARVMEDCYYCPHCGAKMEV